MNADDDCVVLGPANSLEHRVDLNSIGNDGAS